MEKVKIKIVDPKAVVPYKKYDGDFCYDCVAVSEEQVAPNVYKYGLGFALQRAKDTKGDTIPCFSLRARSSVWKTGMILSNGICTIDDLYTGEISAVFYHVMPNMPRYKVGDRVCQMHIDTTTPIEFVECEELEQTVRGDNGYGSTGK